MPIKPSPDEDFEADTISLDDYEAVVLIKPPDANGERVLDVNLPYDDVSSLIDILQALNELTEQVSIRLAASLLVSIAENDDKENP